MLVLSRAMSAQFTACNLQAGFGASRRSHSHAAVWLRGPRVHHINGVALMRHPRAMGGGDGGGHAFNPLRNGSAADQLGAFSRSGVCDQGALSPAERLFKEPHRNIAWQSIR